MDIDRADDVAADLADQHHAGDVEGLGVGDPQAVDERRLLAEPREKFADLRTAAVHHDGFQADGAKQDDVLCKRLRQCRIHHGIPAKFHDDDGVAETLDVGQGLDERVGPPFGREAPVGEVVGHERYPALMSM